MGDTPKISYKEFSASVKEKYPAYAEIDDLELAKKMIEKYPTYKDRVIFDETQGDVKKKEDSAVGGQSESQSKSENIDDLISQLGQPEEASPEASAQAPSDGIVDESLIQDGITPPINAQEPSDATSAPVIMDDRQNKPVEFKEGPRVKTTQEIENEGKVERYLPASGALLDIDRANRFVQEKQAELGTQLTDEDYRRLLSEALRGQAMSQGLSDEEIIKAELDLANDHGINLDITGDGILKTGVGTMASAWGNLQTGTMEAARGVNTFVVGGGIEALKKIGIELPRELEMFLKDEFVNNQTVNGLIDRLSQETRGYEQGLVKSLAEKNYAAAFGMMLDNTSRSLPISVMAGITQGAGMATSMGTLAAMSAGMQYQEVKDQKWFRDMSDAKKAGYLAIMGGAEAIGEYVGGRVLNRVVGDVVKDFGNEAAKKTLKEFTMGAFEAYGINMAEEYAGEMATSLIQNFVDAKAKGEDIDFDKYLLDAVEGGFMGMGGAGITTSVGQSLSAISLANKYRKDYSDQKLENRKTKLEEQINAAAERGAGAEAMTVMIQELAKVNSAIAKRTGIDVEIISRMSSEERAEFTSSLDEAKRLKEVSEDIVDDDELKQAFIDKANEATAKAKGLAESASERNPNQPSQEPDNKVISKENSRNYANLTEDEDGNFVFFHVGKDGYEEVKPSAGGTIATSGEEASAIGKVGGLAMYYTRQDDGESKVSGTSKYAVKIPKEKVYDFNTDNNNYYDEAKKRHEEEHPGKAFDKNTQLAYITKIAGENGYEMVVSEWDGRTRAQTTIAHKPSDTQISSGNTVKKTFDEEYISNTDLGLTPSERLQLDDKKADLFDRMSKLDETNGSRIESKLRKLGFYKPGDKMMPEFPDQETVDRTINESELIPQEMKDEYNELMNTPQIAAASNLDESYDGKKQKYLDAYNDHAKAVSELDQKKESGELTTRDYNDARYKVDQELEAVTRETGMTLKKAGVRERNKRWDDKKKSQLPESGMSKSELESKIKNGVWGMLTAENPDARLVSDADNRAKNAEAKKWLEERGYKAVAIFGKYGNSENSLFVENLSREDAIAFAKEFNQESVATNSGLVYQDGSINERTGEDAFGVSQDNFYSTINTTDGNVDFAVGYNFDEKIQSAKNIEQSRLEQQRAISAETEGMTDEEISNTAGDRIARRVAVDKKADAELEQEVSDLDALMNEPDVDFKTETTTDEETNAIVDEMNAEGGDISKFNIDKAENSVPNTGMQEASNRVGQAIPVVSMKDINGAPVVFTISDQLTSGEVVNPSTGNKIGNLKGGLLYNYVTKGRAWANVSKTKAGELIRSAKLAYENNKAALEKWWKENPEFNNHVPLVVVKMGEGSILSNEATFRLLSDNIAQFSETNQKRALSALKSSLVARGKQSSKAGRDARAALELIEKAGFKNITEVFEESFYGGISLGARASIISVTAYGQPNKPGEASKTSGLPGEGSVARAILGLPSKGSLRAGDITSAQKRKVQMAKDMFHTGTLTDLITEPSIKDVPIRNVISINAIDISDNGGVVSGNHPNYPFAVKGKPIGVLGNSVPVKSAFPKMYAKVLQKAKKNVESGKGTNETSALSAAIPVQMGLAVKDLIGMVANDNPTHADTLAAWMNLAFPNTNVSTSREDFDRVMSDPSVSKKTRKGVTIYGVTINGDVYINPEVHNSQSEIFDTLIHEFGHVWSNTLEQENKALFDKGAELVKKTAEYDKWFKKYKDSGMSDSAASAKAVKEAMSVLIGNKGASITDAALKSKWDNFINAVWNYLSKRFKLSKDLSADDIQNMRLDEFIGTALADIMSGGPISETKPTEGTEMKDGEVFFSSSDTLIETIEKGRLNGFSDSSIKEYLRRQGFSVKEIKEAMQNDFNAKANALESVPTEFGDIEGGMVEGAELFKRAYSAIAEYAKKTTTAGVKPDKKTGKKVPRKRTHQEIRSKAQEIIMSELENINASEMAKLRIMNAFDKAVGLKGGKNVSKDLRDIRKEINLRGKGERSLSQAKVKLRVFIRKYLPLGDYNKSQVMELIKIVNEATNETIQDAESRVIEQVVRQSAKRLFNRIDALKRLKLIKTESGRVKGVVDESTQAFLNDVFSLMPSRTADYAAVEKAYQDMVNEYEAIESKDDLTDEDGNRLAALVTAMEYTSALMMSETDAQIIDNLTNVFESISSFAAIGRNEVKKRAIERKMQYNSMKSRMFEDVSGIEIDYNSPTSVSEAKRKVEQGKNLKDNSGWLRKAVEFLFSPIDMLITRVESIEGLIDRISVTAGKMFEGVGQELITNRIRQASANFKGGKNALMQKLNDKAKDVFGKKYKDILDKNKQQNTFFYTNPKAAAVLEADLAKAKTKKGKDMIQTELNKIKVKASQNELYYLYNQYKDESTHAGFETKFGENYADVMEHITSQMDSKVKEWADWQVDVFFPSLYDRYNDVYRRLYNTNMPMSMTYAGKLVREGDEGSIHTDLFDTNRPYVVNVASGSTKARQKNKKAISSMDGDKMISSYVDEMEFFRSHSEVMRDINKIAKDPLIKKAIEATAGKDVYKVFNTMINRVTERAKMKNDEDRFMDAITNRFVKSKLGFNPTVFIKQLTSAIAFADYIGYRNWAANGIASMQNGVAGFNSDWKEMYANSAVLQDRYENGDISRTLENYVKSTSTSIVPANKMNAFNDMMMYLIKQGDKGGVMGSIPNYRYYKQKFAEQFPNLTEQQIIEKAVAKVEAQITSTQQSSDVVDKDFFQTGGSLMRGLNVFLSSPKALFRKEVVAVRNLYRKMAGKESKGSVKDNLRTLVTYHVAVPMLFQYVSLGFPGLLREWREDDEDELMWAAILGNINAVFILGDIFTSVRDIVLDKPWASSVTNIPTLSVIGALAQDLQKLSGAKTEETTDKYLWKFLIGASEISTGVAVNNLKKFGENIYKVANKETEDIGEDILRVLNYGDYTISGANQKLSEEMKALKKEDPEMFKYVMEMKKEAKKQEEEAEKIKQELLKGLDLE